MTTNVNRARHLLLAGLLAPTLGIVACQDSPTATEPFVQAAASDATASAVRVIRAQIPGEPDIVLVGTNKLMKGNRSVNLTDEQSQQFTRIFEAQTRIDAVVKRMTPAWQKAGLTDIRIAIATRAKEKRADAIAARAIAERLEADNIAQGRTDQIASMSVIPDDPNAARTCNERGIDIYNRTVEYRADIDSWAYWSSESLYCIQNMGSNCGTYAAMAVAYEVSIAWNRFVLDGEAYWYSSLCDIQNPTEG